MLRTCLTVALILALLPVSIACRRAFAEPSAGQSDPDESNNAAPVEPQVLPEIGPDGAPTPPENVLPRQLPFPWPPAERAAEPVVESEPTAPSDSYFSKLKWLGLRHSSTCGRNAGLGIPLVGTSWLNRPYYLGGEIGTIWLTRPVNDDLTTDIDMFGGVFGGCDWDYYWGTELALHRATPELINENARDADRGDRLMELTASLMYYPWGDALFRPYWRCGIGATEIDYPTDAGHRRDEELWTIPVGVGLKYPVRRWLAARAEFADQLALGNHGVATQHDLTLTFGLEWRFGAHPQSYWPWNPSRHIW